MAIFGKLSRYHHFGLLIMRIGLGAMMVFHGYPKLAGGPALWNKLGGSMATLGVHDFPTFWGFMAAFAEAAGGLLLVAGFLFRPALLLLTFTMVVAAMHHFKAGDGWGGASHALELGVVFLGLFIIGPGRFSVDKT